MNYFYEIDRINDKTIKIRITNRTVESVFKRSYTSIEFINDTLNPHPLINIPSHIEITNHLITNMINHNMHTSLRYLFVELVLKDIKNIYEEILLP